MNKTIIICIVVLGLVACVAAQYGGYRPQYETHERKFISLPVPHLRINLDKLTLPVPNLMNLFGITTSRHHEYDDDDDHY